MRSQLLSYPDVVELEEEARAPHSTAFTESFSVVLAFPAFSLPASPVSLLPSSPVSLLLDHWLVQCCSSQGGPVSHPSVSLQGGQT